MDDRFDAVDFENKGELIYAQLSQALIKGVLLPSERLKIRGLAVRMGTSVTPVRDAILRLVQDGALIMLSPRDIRVRSLSLEEYLEIRSIRVELEGMAAARAATQATAEDVKRLRTQMADNERALHENRLADAIALNQDFHFELCRIARMPLLVDILQRLWLKMGPLIAQSYDDGGRHMIDHHYPVVDAIARGDTQAARVAMQTDILSGGQAILKRKASETLKANDLALSAD
ncbi:MAG: GntR family transcriptional regulator [Xenophilus sp.]